MFSGLVEAQGSVRNLQKKGSHWQLALHVGSLSETVTQGDSLSVDGVCMTVKHLEKDIVYFDILPATSEKTTVTSFTEDRMVNIERALRKDQRLDGHIVQGHVDGRGMITRRSDEPTIIEISLPDELHKHCVSGGSIAVNGVSLTIAKQLPTAIEVQVIPETLVRTNLAQINVGDAVNIECDILSRYASIHGSYETASSSPLGVDIYNKTAIQRVQDCITAIRQGEMVIIFDSADRENEGDFFVPAQRVSAEDVSFMAQEGCGLICAPITADIAETLQLPLMVEHNDALHGTMFTVSVDARKGSTTGIASEERAHCMRLLGDPQSCPEDFVRPGHVFPLIAHPEGILKRQGQTEAAVFLAKEAGFTPAGVICEILNKQGRPARWNELQRIAKKLHIQLIGIADLSIYYKEVYG